MLETWSTATWTNGVQVDQLEAMDTLVVETRNSRYEIVVIDPSNAEVIIRGGEFFSEPTPAHVSGASMGGSFLKVRGIYVGLSLELLVDGRRITTTPVHRINADRMLPFTVPISAPGCPSPV
jgi:hypothetical protein